MDHSPFAYASGAPPLPTSTSGASPTLSNYTQDSNPSVSSAYGGMPSTASAAGFNTTAARASQPPVLTPASSAGPPATPLACLACRGKHLKCDGGNPCLRCVAFNSECVYVASRRGYKGPSRKAAAAANPNKRMRSSSSSPPPSSTQSDSCPMMLGMPAVSMPGMVTSSSFTPGVRLDTTMPMAPTTSAALSPYISLTPGPPARMAQHTPDPSHVQLYRTSYLTADLGEAALAVTLPTQPVTSMGQKCFDSFYHHFFAAHPFVLPKDNMIRLVNEGSAKLDHLLAAMRYIGSLFVDAGPARAMYLDEALRLAYLPSCPRDGFLVQTLLMLIVGLDGNCNQEKARELLGDCERLALEIGLNGRPFATANGRSDPSMEESWRRTWWDLFVVDGMVAGVHRVTNFLLYDVESTVALPCEEHQYLSGSIPMPMYIEDFDDQVFSGEDREFSSFAYRIAAARILGRFMRCPPILFPDDENMGKIESLLTNWRIHLPPSKRDNLTKNCTLDEMMFQAHFMNHACSILLHQPHSQLDSSPARSVNSCAPHSVVPSGDAFNAHTRHTITAACEISKMITQAVPLHSHTHFFTCVITLSSIVHLSKWALYFIQDEEDLRQLIRLNIGALGKLSDVWKAAATASGQVRGVAQEIYRAKKAQQINPAFWVGFTQEEMIQSLNADEGIMSEFNSMSGFGQVPTTMAISQPMSQP